MVYCLYKSLKLLCYDVAFCWGGFSILYLSTTSAELKDCVIPVKAGLSVAVYGNPVALPNKNWIPAFAGMTQLTQLVIAIPIA